MLWGKINKILYLFLSVALRMHSILLCIELGRTFPFLPLAPHQHILLLPTVH